MKFLLLVALIAGAVAEIVYDSLPSSGPSVVSATLVGAGELVTPNPFKSIKYSSKFRVLKLDGELVQILSAPSSPNVLVSANVSIADNAGFFQEFSTDYPWDIRAIYFACVTELAGEIIPIACNVLFDGRLADSSSWGSVTDTVAYGGGQSFQRADLGFKHVKSLSFAVVQAGKFLIGEVAQVSLLLDSFYYTPNAKKPTYGARDSVA